MRYICQFNQLYFGITLVVVLTRMLKNVFSRFFMERFPKFVILPFELRNPHRCTKTGKKNVQDLQIMCFNHDLVLSFNSSTAVLSLSFVSSLPNNISFACPSVDIVVNWICLHFVGYCFCKLWIQKYQKISPTLKCSSLISLILELLVLLN